MPSALQTLEQTRAKNAWSCVQEVKDKPFADKYRSIALKVPSLIVTNGLGQTLAFLKAKGSKEEREKEEHEKEEPEKKAHETLYRHLSLWLQKQLSLDSDLLEWIIETARSQQYRLATMEALAFLQWLKRFAEAELPKGREK